MRSTTLPVLDYNLQQIETMVLIVGNDGKQVAFILGEEGHQDRAELLALNLNAVHGTDK